jgi:GDP-4-dehydro-6-deoxy-D-mannose reductase
MKVLVTGGTGFVGPYLVRHCRDAGDEVITPGDHAHGFDITDRARVMETIAAHRPDAVYHLAARSHVGDSWADPISTLRTNVEGTANVLDAARAHGVQRVLVVGSGEEYGRVDDRRAPIREDAPLRPLSPYGASKVAASYLALQAFLGSGLETIRVRTFSHTGPGQLDRFFVPALARRIAQAERTGTATIAIGNVEPVRDFSDVRDIVRAYRALVVDGTPGEVYNVGRGTGVTVAEIAVLLLQRARTELVLEPDPALIRPADIPWLVGDGAKLRAATGWVPAFTLEQTLSDVLEEARDAVQGS